MVPSGNPIFSLPVGRVRVGVITDRNFSLFIIILLTPTFPTRGEAVSG